MTPLIPIVGWTPPATFPVVEGVATSANDTETTTHTLNLPAGIAAGDLLVAVIRTASSAATLTPPAGWTLVATHSTTLAAHVIQKVASGSEGTSTTFTLGSTRRSVAIAYRISNVATGEASFVEADWSSSSGPSLTASWGSANNLWLTAATTRDNAPAFTTPPTGYAEATQVANVGGPSVGYAVAAVARKEAATATDDPAVWANTGTLSNPSFATIAVRPAA